jgi:hypothetical protein
VSLRYLVDTAWVIHWLNGREDIRHRLDEVKEEGLGLSVVSLAELYEGVYHGRNQRAAEEGLRGQDSGGIKDAAILSVPFPVVRNLHRRWVLAGVRAASYAVVQSAFDASVASWEPPFGVGNPLLSTAPGSCTWEFQLQRWQQVIPQPVHGFARRRLTDTAASRASHVTNLQRSPGGFKAAFRWRRSFAVDLLNRPRSEYDAEFECRICAISWSS